MTRPQNVWKFAEPEREICQDLVATLGISPVIAKVLYNRGIKNEQEADAFINCSLEQIPEPFLLKDMELAVAAIFGAIEQGDKVLVYGDYDVDGVTSTTLLLDALEAIGCKAGFYIPDRMEEGYGLNISALDDIAARGFKLIISVDCGISAVQEAEYAQALGLKLIITDHHEPPVELPKATAIINPKQPGCTYPFKHLAGVGVAFKLAQALIQRSSVGLDESLEGRLLDLVALGTIADIVPILGENRILVKHGLHCLTYTNRVGLKALIEVSGLADRQLSPGHVGFTLAPRINATGRIGDAGIAVQLLRTDDDLRAREMAVYLDGENRERQELEAEILAEALAMLADFNPERDKVLVLARQGWHPGVIGIVASRLVERFYRPVIMVALDGEEGKGSGRSISGFNLFEALELSQHLLLRFGGHKQAAGLAIKSELIPELRRELNLFAESLDPAIYLPQLNIDAAVSLSELDEQLVLQLKGLEPFGFGNPSPVLAVHDLQLVEVRLVGKEKNHLKIKVKDQTCTVDGIGFSLVRLMEDLDQHKPVKVAFTPELNEYKGRTSVQLQLKDLQNHLAEVAGQDLNIVQYYSSFSAVENSILQALTQGTSLEGIEQVSLEFPLLAAASQVLHTGLPSLLVYPMEGIINRVVLSCAELLDNMGLEARVNPGTGEIDHSTIVLLSAEFFAQNVVKIMEMRYGAVILDTVDHLIPMAEQIPAPLLRANTSSQIVNSFAPNRERLLRLYQALRQAAGPGGMISGDALNYFAEVLGEPPQFVTYGLHIFEELQIIRQEKQQENRIFYFQAPAQKLDLLDSPSFSNAQRLITEFNKLQEQYQAIS